MARRKRRSRRPRAPQRDDEDSRPQAPFNDAIASSLQGLSRELSKRRARRAASTDSRKAVAVQPATPARAVAREESDAELLARAFEGAAPMAPGARRVGPRLRPDSSGVKAIRDEDVRAMASLENFDIRFSDQYIRGSADGVSSETLRRLERGEFAVRAHIDLHGMVVEDAAREVDRFLSDCHRKGLRCVLVITGKGRNSLREGGVLRREIPAWLSRGPSSRLVLAFVTARACDGGEGALYVLLRRRIGAKGRIDVITGGVGD